MHGTVILVVDDHAQSIRAVLGELAVAAFELRSESTSTPTTIDVLVVDTGSSDGTVSIARDGAAQLGLDLDVISTDRTTVWSTQRDAFAHVLAREHVDFVVTLDPAGHHDARQLPDLLRAFRSTGSGVTIGSRWVQGGTAPGTSAGRSLLSRVASFAVARASGLRRVRDTTTSFRVIRPDAAELVGADPASVGDYGFYCEFVATAQAYGFTVGEVPITFRPRFADVQRLRWHDLVEFARDVRRIRRRVATIRSEVAHDQATWAARSGRLRDQAAAVGSEFGALAELTELSGADRFSAWIVEALAPAIGGRVVDVGAGLGSIATLVVRRAGVTEVVAIEPAGNVFPQLAERTSSVHGLTAHQVTSSELADERAGTFDSALYVNVLEHIDDDVAELATARRLIAPRGRIGVFVPAMPSLYGHIDFVSGHHRRYTAGELEDRLAEAGFVDIDVRHLDVVGVVPYWVMYRLLDVSRLDRASLTGYDRVVVPVSRLLQRIVPRPPFGKNLVATASRPD